MKRPRSKSTMLPSMTNPTKKVRATFRAPNVPQSAMYEIMKHLSNRNLASMRMAFPSSSGRTIDPELKKRRQVKSLVNKLNNFGRTVNPAYIKVVNGLRKYIPNVNTPINNYGTNLGYHTRRVNRTKRMLNSLQLGNNGFYYTPNRRNKYSFRHGSLSTVHTDPGRATVVFVQGLKRDPTGRLRFKY